MKQLELRSYPRAEIAEVLSVNINDSKHFKRNVENKLSKWGYGYDYDTPAVEILSKPETPEERLSELLIREYGIDVQTNPILFAYYITAFWDIEGFNCMPWAERANAYYKQYSIWVDDRTMRNWNSRLISRGVIVKSIQGIAWKTVILSGKKYRTKVEEEDKEDMQHFFNRRWELVKENLTKYVKQGLPQKAAKNEAWSAAYKILWQDYSCCYYYCKDFMLTAFTDDDEETLYAIYELVEEIIADPLRPKITNYTKPIVRSPKHGEFVF